MSNPISTPAESLADAGHALRQVLLRLDGYAKSRVKSIKSGPYAEAAMRHVSDIDALIVAVEAYEQAVQANMVPVPHDRPDIMQMTPAELLAYRERDPIYRLGFVRGHKRGLEQAAEPREKAISLYSQHAGLPPPVDLSALMLRVRKFIDYLTSRYGKGQLPHY